MPIVKSVAVFCGSRHGHDPIWRESAEELGLGLAAAGISLVYGGGRVGLMGVVADSVLAGGGQVTGVIPDFLMRREVAHPEVENLIVTADMHSRKQRMFSLSDAFIMMPGGLGTYDEVIEIITWRQLGLHDKPVLLCDIAGSAQPIHKAMVAAVEMGFADPSALELFETVDGVAAVLRRLTGLEVA